MEPNPGDSLNIMEDSLCLDEQHAASAPKPAKTSPMSNASGNRLSQFKSNLNSFYFTNDDDERDEEVISENEVRPAAGRNAFSDGLSKTSSSNNIGNNGIELDTVKHKLSSLWNNVKYGRCAFFYAKCDRVEFFLKLKFA
jgi:hypothetical protein